MRGIQLAWPRPCPPIVITQANGSMAHPIPIHRGACRHHTDKPSLLGTRQRRVAISEVGRGGAVAHGNDILPAPSPAAIFTAADAHVYLVVAQVGIAVISSVASHNDITLPVKNHGWDAIETAMVCRGDIGKALHIEDLRPSLRVAYLHRNINLMQFPLEGIDDLREHRIDIFAKLGMALQRGRQPKVVHAIMQSIAFERDFHPTLPGNRLSQAQRMRVGIKLQAVCLAYFQ